jgi:hypothetical protein
VVFYNFYLRRVNNIMTDIESVSKKVNVLLFGGQASLAEHVTVVNEAIAPVTRRAVLDQGAAGNGNVSVI